MSLLEQERRAKNYKNEYFIYMNKSLEYSMKPCALECSRNTYINYIRDI